MLRHLPDKMGARFFTLLAFCPMHPASASLRYILVPLQCVLLEEESQCLAWALCRRHSCCTMLAWNPFWLVQSPCQHPRYFSPSSCFLYVFATNAVPLRAWHANMTIDFSLPGVRNEFGYVPAPANYIRPNKRPLSSITPVIVDHISNNSLYFVIGAAGGSRIPSATMQALWHVLDHDMTVSQALAAPRFHDQLVPAVTTFEYAFDNATVAAMHDREHNVTWVPPGLSSVQGLRLGWNGEFEAAGEPRQKNSAGMIV